MDGGQKTSFETKDKCFVLDDVRVHLSMQDSYLVGMKQFRVS